MKFWDTALNMVSIRFVHQSLFMCLTVFANRKCPTESCSYTVSPKSPLCDHFLSWDQSNKATVIALSLRSGQRNIRSCHFVSWVTRMVGKYIKTTITVCITWFHSLSSRELKHVFIHSWQDCWGYFYCNSHNLLALIRIGSVLDTDSCQFWTGNGVVPGHWDMGSGPRPQVYNSIWQKNRVAMLEKQIPLIKAMQFIYAKESDPSTRDF